MVFSYPKVATQHHKQHNEPYYEATAIILGRKRPVKIVVDKQKIKIFV